MSATRRLTRTSAQVGQPIVATLRQRDSICKDAASRFLGQCVILGSATGTCCASGGASWLEVEAPSLPNRCLHLAQTAGAGLKFEGALVSVQPLAPLHLPMVRAEVPVQVQRCLCSLPQDEHWLVYSVSHRQPSAFCVRLERRPASTPTPGPPPLAHESASRCSHWHSPARQGADG